MSIKFHKNNQGMIVLLALVLVATILGLLFIIFSLIVPRLTLSRSAYNWIPAFYTAESVVDYCLYVDTYLGSPVSPPTMSNGGTYSYAPQCQSSSGLPIIVRGVYPANSSMTPQSMTVINFTNDVDGSGQ